MKHELIKWLCISQRGRKTCYNEPLNGN